MGPEEVLERRDSALTTHHRATAPLRRHDTVEIQPWSVLGRFAGSIVMEKKEEAISTAKGHCRENTVWTDGSRLEGGRVGAVGRILWDPKSPRNRGRTRGENS